MAKVIRKYGLKKYEMNELNLMELICVFVGFQT